MPSVITNTKKAHWQDVSGASNWHIADQNELIRMASFAVEQEVWEESEMRSELFKVRGTRTLLDCSAIFCFSRKT